MASDFSQKLPKFIPVIPADAGNYCAVYIAALLPELLKVRSIPHQSQTDGVLLRPKLRTGHAFRSVKVNHFTIFIQIIKFSTPIGTDGKDIHMIAANIVNFLTLVLLDDNFVRQAGGPHALDALHQGLLHIDLAPGLVEILGGHAHDQVIAQRLGPLKQADMAVMQQIIGSVCDYFRHKNPPALLVRVHLEKRVQEYLHGFF